MIHYLPAACLSTFLFSPRYVPSPQPQNISQANQVNGKAFNGIKVPNFAEEANTDITVANLRVVAVNLTNNTDECIVLKNKLRLKLNDPFANMVEITPPALSKRQITSVYFLYNLLLQNLPAAPEPISFGSTAFENAENLRPVSEDIFLTNIQNIDISNAVKEAQLLNKSIAPGQNLTGLIYFYTTSSAPIQFYLN